MSNWGGRYEDPPESMDASLARGNAWKTFAHPNRVKAPKPPDPPTRAIHIAESNAIPPFSEELERDCDDCGGKGYDLGGLDQYDADPCPHCNGSGKETYIRQWLGEAFQIAADKPGAPAVEIAHVRALCLYARQTISALMAEAA